MESPQTPRSFRSFMSAPPAPFGVVVGLVFWWWSLTPTLLPRAWMIQAAVSALSIAVGYGIGSAIGAGIRWISRRLDWSGLSGSHRRLAWLLAGAAVIVLLAGSAVLWFGWQNEQRDLVSMDHLAMWNTAAMVGLAAVLTVVLIMIGRLIGYGIYRLNGFLARWMPTAIRVIAIGVLVVVVSVVLAQDVVAKGFIGWANSTYGASNTGSDPGVVQPTSQFVSGGQDSLISWESLGWQGRTFTAGATKVSDLAEFAGPGSDPAEPIRVYAGLRSADTDPERAALVVQELERTGAGDREIVVVAGTTGTGFIDPDAATAIEYIHNGDTAIAGMQYSYLPSWISFMADKEKAAASAAVIYQAVTAWWSQLPEAGRPRLIVFGESLGSYGSESSINGTSVEASMRRIVEGTDGVLWAGPTEPNPVWGQLIGAREPGTPVWRPVYDGETMARVANTTDEINADDGGWAVPRVLHLHHPSDPVGYWTWDTLWKRPDWTREPIGYDVSPRVAWYPFVTFWQVVADLMAGFDAPAGYGHNYSPHLARAWTAVAPADGWTAADTARLEAHLIAIVPSESG